MSQHKTVMERVAELEQALPALTQIVQNEINNRLLPIVQTLNAITEILGRDMVTLKIKEQNALALQQEVEKKKAQLEVLVAEGRIVKTDAVTENSVIVGKETDMEGNPTAERTQVVFAEVHPTFQEQLLGKGVGHKVEAKGLGFFEVTEVYNFVKQAEVAQ